MPLVEIIVGKETSDATLARSLDLVKALGMTPIVVNDARGFYAGRVFSTYVLEGLAMLAEGVAPALIDNAGLQAGMPVGPLALNDETALDLGLKILRAAEADLGPAAVDPRHEESCWRTMVEKRTVAPAARTARGFYDYAPGQAEAAVAGARRAAAEQAHARTRSTPSTSRKK